MDEAAIRARLATIKEEHRDLDAAIEAIQATGVYDLLQVQRLKKRKLILKDEMSKLEAMLVPDIIA